jgi:hypothetical protein
LYAIPRPKPAPVIMGQLLLLKNSSENKLPRTSPPAEKLKGKSIDKNFNDKNRSKRKSMTKR